MFREVQLRKVRTNDSQVTGLTSGLRPAGTAGFTDPKAQKTKTELVRVRRRDSNTSPTSLSNTEVVGKRTTVRRPSVVESLPSTVLSDPVDEDVIISEWASTVNSRVEEFTHFTDQHKSELLKSVINELPWASRFTFEQLLNPPIVVILRVVDTSILSGSGVLSGRLHSNNYTGSDWVGYMLLRFSFPLAEDYKYTVRQQLERGYSVYIDYQSKRSRSMLIITPSLKYLGVVDNVQV